MANKKGALAVLAAGAAAAVMTVAALRRTRRLQAEARAAGKHVPYGPYEAVAKRPLDAALSVGALVALSPLYVTTAIAVCVKLGSPVLFKQFRPGIKDSETGSEILFEMYKFRSMTDECNPATGKLLPDQDRLTDFGKWLRGTSLDELPELINVIKGDMALIGPRPQLVHDMVFMSQRQRERHAVRPGLSGLAQVSGRNALSWDKKLETDLVYIDKITFLTDVRIIVATLRKVLFPSAAEWAEADMTEDYGAFLLRNGKIDEQEYSDLMAKAAELLGNDAAGCSRNDVLLVPKQ